VLSVEHWEWVQRSMPIACVDPVEPAWCLIGGRVFYGENTNQAGERILLEAGGDGVHIETAEWGHPDYLAEYLPSNVTGLLDPRKHAIGMTFIVTISGTFVPQGEAIKFDWFDLVNLPSPLGFGQRTIIDEVFGRRESRG
jgi:hypothetical protein